MKRYHLKRIKEENDLDHHTPPSCRKRFNSVERQYAKREIHKAQEVLIEDKEIKTRDIYDLQIALDRKLNNITFNFARTLHNFGIPLVPGGEKTVFSNTFNWRDFDNEYDYSHMTEAELLEMLALTTNSNYVIDLNLAIENARYPWY
ncbi:hypothetical protein UFOVP53_100 [uncultured Caudovirales phage]|uniref:Uncharacterized protein n=1 Tax=uncultured Caudovirales phage TaxID=2100421 RepID=A0A6J5KW58_9CAUD|nr:hypothetical protein UFOVP53_100 [uncultured Caudovirales phage]